MQFLEISAILLTYLSRSEVETFIVKVLLDLLLPLRKLNLLSAFKLVESEIKFSGYNFRNKNCISTISIDTFIQYWSSRPEVFCEKDVLRNFTKFTGKHLCQRLFFDKVAGLRLSLVNFDEFQRTPFLIEHLWLLLLQCEED